MTIFVVLSTIKTMESNMFKLEDYCDERLVRNSIKLSVGDFWVIIDALTILVYLFAKFFVV